MLETALMLLMQAENGTINFLLLLQGCIHELNPDKNLYKIIVQGDFPETCNILSIYM